MTDPTKIVRPNHPGRKSAPRQAQELPPLPVTRARIGKQPATEIFQDMGENMVEDLQEIRRDLHRHPEIGLDLPRTQKKVLEALEGLPLEIHVGQDLSSVVAVLRGGKRGERPVSVLLRADMDALPIQEAATDLPWASTRPGVMHACGHDGHTAMLLGAATLLAKNPPPRPVRLIFQPAEEQMPGGAVDCVEDGAIEGVDRIIALHCDPHRVVGDVGVHAGAITSSNAKIEVTLTSHGGHTARPHETGDLIYALASIATGAAQVIEIGRASCRERV